MSYNKTGYASVFNASNRPSYISAPQGKLYINGIHIDECYDIQYMYQELKQPIFGYNSKYYDAILPGQVTVAGSFTINYIHDAYLLRVLDKAREDQEGSITKRKLLDTKDRLDKEASEYKRKLQEWKAIVDRDKEAEEERPGLELIAETAKITLDQLTREMTTLESIGAVEARRVEKKYTSYVNAQDENTREQIRAYVEIWQSNDKDRYFEGSQLISYPAVREGFALYLDTKKQRDSLITSRNELQRRIDSAKESLATTQGALDALDADLGVNGSTKNKMKNELATLKARMDDSNAEIVNDFRNFDRQKSVVSEGRAESGGKFTIMLEYNGKTHKIITDVELLGHSHVMGHTGRPVQEVYKFVARNVE